MTGRAAWAITANELRRLRSHGEVVLLGLFLPVVIMTLIGFAFGTGGSIDLGVADLDGSDRSRALVERLADAEGVELKRHDDLDELRRDVRTTAVQLGIVIPVGYERDLAAGGAVVELVLDPQSDGVATALATVDGVVTSEGVQEAAVQAVADRTGDRASAAAAVEAQAGLPRVEVREVDRTQATVDTGRFSHTTPANLTLFVFVSTFAVSTIVAFDRRDGTIARMVSTPTRVRAVVLGIGAAKLAFALLQSALLVVIGTFAFGVEWGDPLGAVAIVILFALVATGAGVLVGAWVSDGEQAQAMGIPLSIGMGMLGGCMWPIEIVPRPMQVVGHVTPHAWAMDSWTELIFRGGTVGDILPNLAVLAAIATGLGALATRRLRRAVAG